MSLQLALDSRVDLIYSLFKDRNEINFDEDDKNKQAKALPSGGDDILQFNDAILQKLKIIFSGRKEKQLSKKMFIEEIVENKKVFDYDTFFMIITGMCFYPFFYIVYLFDRKSQNLQMNQHTLYFSRDIPWLKRFFPSLFEIVKVSFGFDYSKALSGKKKKECLFFQIMLALFNICYLLTLSSMIIFLSLVRSYKLFVIQIPSNEEGSFGGAKISVAEIAFPFFIYIFITIQFALIYTGELNSFLNEVTRDYLKSLLKDKEFPLIAKGSYAAGMLYEAGMDQWSKESFSNPITLQSDEDNLHGFTGIIIMDNEVSNDRERDARSSFVYRTDSKQGFKTSLKFEVLDLYLAYKTNELKEAIVPGIKVSMSWMVYFAPIVLALIIPLTRLIYTGKFLGENGSRGNFVVISCMICVFFFGTIYLYQARQICLDFQEVCQHMRVFTGVLRQADSVFIEENTVYQIPYLDLTDNCKLQTLFLWFDARAYYQIARTSKNRNMQTVILLIMLAVILMFAIIFILVFLPYAQNMDHLMETYQPRAILVAVFSTALILSAYLLKFSTSIAFVNELQKTHVAKLNLLKYELGQKAANLGGNEKIVQNQSLTTQKAVLDLLQYANLEQHLKDYDILINLYGVVIDDAYIQNIRNTLISSVLTAFISFAISVFS